MHIKIPEQPICTITDELIEKQLPYRFEYYFFLRYFLYMTYMYYTIDKENNKCD